MPEKTQYAQTKRVLAILQALCTTGEPLSLSQISDRVSSEEKRFSDRTIYRDLNFLEWDMKYVFREKGTKGYLLRNYIRFPLSQKQVRKWKKSR